MANRRIEIIPSLASANQLNLQAAIDSMGKIERLHMDIEDGNFISNITFGMKTVGAVARYKPKRLDAHLMVSNPLQYINEMIHLGIRDIAIHVEAVNYPAEILHYIRKQGSHAGLAFNLQAPVDVAAIYQEELDYVLLMTSEPDGKKQQFKSCALDRIARAREILPESVSIVVDGGIIEENLKDVISAGADTIIMGRAIWEDPFPEERYRNLMRKANIV